MLPDKENKFGLKTISRFGLSKTQLMKFMQGNTRFGCGTIQICITN